MKRKIIFNSLLVASMAVLTACPGKRTEEAKKAVGPQGRITSFSNQNTYCDVNNGTIMCSSIDAMTGMVCNSASKSYTTTDISSFCQQIYQVQIESQTNLGRRCAISDVTSRIISEHCGGVAIPNQNNSNTPFNPNNPVNPNDPNQDQYGYVKDVQCEFEARRSTTHLGGFINGFANIARTPVYIRLDSRVESTYEFNKKYLMPSLLGKISMSFIPAGFGSNSADMIVVRNSGLKGNTTVSQAGFAGDSVKLQVRARGVFVDISCKGVSRFKSAEQNHDRRFLDCNGSTRTLGNGREQIAVSLPLSEISNGREFRISNSVMAKINNNASSISFSAEVDRDYIPELLTTASLRADAILKARDELADIDLNCHIQ